MVTVWTQAEAVALCRQIEQIAPDYGLHVALTGGLLYKDGPRKDADILLYRVRDWQPGAIAWDALFEELRDKLGIKHDPMQDFGWCKKATWQGRSIDFFNPDDDGQYGDDMEGEMPTFDDALAAAIDSRGGAR